MPVLNDKAKKKRTSPLECKIYDVLGTITFSDEHFAEKKLFSILLCQQTARRANELGICRTRCRRS